MLRPLMVLLESTPALFRGADEIASVGSKLADEAAELLTSAPKIVSKTDDTAQLALKETGQAELAIEGAKATASKYAPVYEREGNRLFFTQQKLDRLKLTNIETAPGLETPQIKLFPDAPPKVTLPVDATDITKANAVLIADYANVIHWSDEARAAVSMIERPSTTFANQWTKFPATAEQMEQMAVEGATGYLQGIRKNAFSEFLSKNFGRYYFERLYHARSSVLNCVFRQQ